MILLAIAYAALAIPMASLTRALSEFSGRVKGDETISAARLIFWLVLWPVALIELSVSVVRRGLRK